MLRTAEKKLTYRVKSLSGSWNRRTRRLQHKTARQHARRYIREKLCF